MEQGVAKSKQESTKNEIVWMNPLDLVPYGNNPRKNDKAVDAVAESIRKFGFNVPITVDEHNVVATGHTRLKAAIKLGMTRVPVIVLHGLSDEQIRAWRLVDNKTSELSDWDLPKLEEELNGITGIDMSSFDFKLPSDAEELKEDDFDGKLPSAPKAKRGEIYQLGRHRLMCGDSTNKDDMDALTMGGEADIVMTDPPYNVDYQGKAGKIMNDKMTPGQWREFLQRAFGLMQTHLKPGGVCYAWSPSQSLYLMEEAIEAAGIPIRQTLIWNKSSFTLGRQDYQWKHEPCLYGWKEGAPHYFVNDRGFSTVLEERAQDVSKMKAPDLRKLVKDLMKDQKIPLDVIDEDKPVKSEDHPTMKPIRIVGRMIANSSRKDELVLDPFGGSGSTLIACEELGRRCQTMELDPKYVDVIIERWEKFTGGKATLVKSA